MYIVAQLISKHLNLDVPGLGYVFFDEHSVVREGLESLSLTRLKRLVELAFVMDNTHSLSSSSGNCLYQNWILHLVSLLEQKLRGLILSVITRHDWNVCCGHDLFRLALASHRSYSRGGRTNELHSVLDALLGETSILWEEAETRMQGLAVRVFGNLQYFGPVEVGLGGRVVADPVGLVG